jgi:CMP-N-acetylneuraminic acid synthetase
MFGLIPIILESENDIMQTESGRNIIYRFLIMHKKVLSITDRLIITNHSSIPEIAEKCSIPYRFLDGKNRYFRYKISLPNLLHLIKEYAIALSSPDLVIANFRNPFLDESIINRALKLYHTLNASILSSVVLVKDHPCLLYRLKKEKVLEPEDKTFINTHGDSCFKREPFPSSPALWERKSNSRLTNTITGKDIQGRQDFPEVYEYEGSIIITRAEKVYPASRSHLCDWGYHGFPMEPHKSINITTRMDLLKYFVMLKESNRSSSS